MWKLIANEFEQIWQFPHCIGTLDGKHIVIKKPPKSGTSFYNYKQTFSVVLMASVDAHYKFISIDIGSMGRFSDANIFTSGALAKKLYKKTLRLPPPSIMMKYYHTFSLQMKRFRYLKMLCVLIHREVLRTILKIKCLVIDFLEHGKLLNALLEY